MLYNADVFSLYNASWSHLLFLIFTIYIYINCMCVCVLLLGSFSCSVFTELRIFQVCKCWPAQQGMFYAFLNFSSHVSSVLQFKLFFYLRLLLPSFQVVDTVCSLFREFFTLQRSVISLAPCLIYRISVVTIYSCFWNRQEWLESWAFSQL